MSYKKYSASERRGIMAIAIIALLITGVGVFLSFRKMDNKGAGPETEILNELRDTVLQRNERIDYPNKKNKKESSKSNSKKVYRQRSPLDEPV